MANLAITRAGTVAHLQLGAWSDAEGGHTWALTDGCGMCVPVAQDAEDAVLLLEVWPQTAPPERPARTMWISRDGRLIGRLTLDRRGTHAVALGAVYAEALVNLDFAFDAAVPILGEDPRPFAFAFRSVRIIGRGGVAALGRASPYVEAGLGAFLMRFQSLGHCCDLGSFQERCGAAALSLLRYGSINIHDLIDAVIDRFARLGAPGSIEVLVVAEEDGRYWMFDKLYGMSWHTGLGPGETTPEALVRREVRRLPLLRRMFLEVLDGAGKIFVLRRPWPVHVSEAEALAETLRLFGDCTLLWAVQGEGVVGTVEVLKPYLLRGHLDVAERRGAASVQAWAAVCANAVRAMDDARRAKLF